MLGKLGVRNRQVFGILMFFALALVVARLAAPFEVGKDQALQLEAAQRLTQGLGLTITHTQLDPLDIAEAPIPIHITWWPPAFSLIVAGPLRAGLPLLLSLKIIYAVISLVGWVGWAIIASHLLEGSIRWKRRGYSINLLIASVLPIIFTPLWDGTDLFLWAGVPFIVILTSKAKAERKSYLTVASAGLLFGFLYAIRYASLFVPLAAILILLQVSMPNVRSFLKRSLVFLLSSLFIILPTVAYIKLFSTNASYMPVYVNVENKPHLGSALIEILKTSIFTSNMILGHPLLARIIDSLHSKVLLYVSGLCSLLIVLAAPFILLKSRERSLTRSSDDLAVSVSFLPVAISVFFGVSTFTLHWSPFAIERYYVPVIVCGILISYQLLASRPVQPILKFASGSVVLSFFIYVGVYLPIRANTPKVQHEVAKAVLGYTPAKSPGYTSTSYPISYPQWVLYSRKENSRAKLRELYQANPDAIFYVMENYQYYVYDRFDKGGPVAGEALRYFPRRDFWQQAYTSRPIKVFWVLDYPSASVNLSWLGFVPESNLREIYFDPSEKTRILVSEFPAGYKFLGV